MLINILVINLGKSELDCSNYSKEMNIDNAHARHVPELVHSFCNSVVLVLYSQEHRKIDKLIGLEAERFVK